ncbi:MAG: hypothetical protein KDI69_01960, partial [Xanthomonadales bacterium]|nr:hypothetical protein [Xanthomonadales bacterium]
VSAKPLNFACRARYKLCHDKASGDKQGRRIAMIAQPFAHPAPKNLPIEPLPAPAWIWDKIDTQGHRVVVAPPSR